MNIHPGRLVHFEGTTNFRDLGGYENIHGKTIKWGKIYRSDRLNKLSEEDQDMLLALKVNTIVDFRRNDEVKAFPNSLPKEKNINIIHLPVISGINGIGVIEDLVNGNSETNLDGTEMMHKANVFYVCKAREQFSNFLRLLTDEKNLPLIFHCAAGKDRTGFAAALLLSALEIPKKIIIEDYLLSNYYRQTHIVKKMNEAAKKINPELIRPLLEVKKEYLQAAFNEIMRLYGSVNKFLSNALGLTANDIQKLKSNFLE
ncbi:MAG: tyrosine-protein phosphatase [Bacteroidota bacterium]